MTRLDLLNELHRRLTDLFKDYSLPNKAGVLQNVAVFKQYLPQPQGITFADRNTGIKSYSESDYESNFPCVIVKLDEMTDYEERSRNHSQVNVTLLAGVYDESPECQGYQDILNLQEVMRAYLLEHRVVGRKFVLNMPLKSRLLELDTWPVWFGEMTLTFTAGRPVMRNEWVSYPAMNTGQ